MQTSGSEAPQCAAPVSEVEVRLPAVSTRTGLVQLEPPAVQDWPGLQGELRVSARRWLVTGAAGFIGSHLVETLLGLGQRVVALDNLSTGHRSNLEEVAQRVGDACWSRCTVIEGDIRDAATCTRALAPAADDGAGMDHVLHQAALGSVPRSLRDPLATHDSNVTGFLNMLVAARDAGVRSFVYASSSSVYGDHPALPKVESVVGAPLSPYAASKAANELYAGVFARSYHMQVTGLRYFNVFGPRQDPNGAYAAVIPLWTASLLRGDTVWINGDGTTSRDFCYVANAVQANLLAACAPRGDDGHRVYNVAVGEQTSLLELFALLKDVLASQGMVADSHAALREFRPGDVRHSLADIGRAREELGYLPTHDLPAGLREAMPWYVASLRRGGANPAS